MNKKKKKNEPFYLFSFSLMKAAMIMMENMTLRRLKPSSPPTAFL